MSEKVFGGTPEQALLKHIKELTEQNTYLKKELRYHKKYVLECCEGIECSHCGAVRPEHDILKATVNFESFPVCSKECLIEVIHREDENDLKERETRDDLNDWLDKQGHHGKY